MGRFATHGYGSVSLRDAMGYPVSRTSSTDTSVQRLIMVTLLPLVALLAFSTQTPHNRTEFVTALQRVEVGWTKQRVQRALGEPDDLWPVNDSHDYVQHGEDRWCYGTNGHHTMATLGSVTFRDGVVRSVVGQEGTAPLEGSIGEEELRAALRALYQDPSHVRRGYDSFSGSDPGRTIRAANALIGLGPEKALPMLKEYGRLAAERWSDEWLFWVVRAAYVAKPDVPVFAVPVIAMNSWSRPTNLQSWPTYPVAIVDDIPFCMLKDGGYSGAAEGFSDYLLKHISEWSLRTMPLVPPADPFPSMQDLLAHPLWPTDAEMLKNDPDAVSDVALFEVMELIKPVLTVKVPNPWDQLPVDEIHRRFLALECRWDAGLQSYVRKDGSILPNTRIPAPQEHFDFVGIPRHKVKLSFWRQDEHHMRVEMMTTELGTGPIAKIFLIAENSRDGGELQFVSSGGTVLYANSLEKKLALAEEPRRVWEREYYGDASFPFTKGRPMRFVILFEGKRYVSPDFSP